MCIDKMTNGVIPTYDEICYGFITGFVEVVVICFDNSKVKYEDLCKFLFTFHDPTTLNR